MWRAIAQLVHDNVRHARAMDAVIHVRRVLHGASSACAGASVTSTRSELPHSGREQPATGLSLPRPCQGLPGVPLAKVSVGALARSMRVICVYTCNFANR